MITTPSRAAGIADAQGEQAAIGASVLVPEVGLEVALAARATLLTRASVADKLTRYLLNSEHAVGGAKAAWFEKALGFTQANSGQLAKQIVFDASKAVQTGVTEFGTKYNQVISITGANGRVIDVTFAWIRNNDGIVRLVTGIPTAP